MLVFILLIALCRLLLNLEKKILVLNKKHKFHALNIKIPIFTFFRALDTVNVNIICLS